MKRTICFNWLSRQQNLLTLSLLVISISLHQIQLSSQLNFPYHHSVSSSSSSSSSFPDEEITIESDHANSFYSQQLANASQIAHETASRITSAPIQSQFHREQLQNQAQNTQHFVDPFAVTFEDYLKEANQISAHHISDEKSSELDSLEQPEILIAPEQILSDNNSSSPSKTLDDHVNVPASDSLNKPKSYTIIDYIFPPSKQDEQEKTPVAGNLKHEQHNTFTDETITSHSIHNVSDALNFLNEIKLLFAWKQLPTNKCSKTCGKGFRLNHLSCVDLKYNVKVEDELCSNSNLNKPNELSDEPCNQIDCPPSWTTTKFFKCAQAHATETSSVLDSVSDMNDESASRSGACQSGTRQQCSMINRDGILLYLDDSKCNYTTDEKTATISYYSVVHTNLDQNLTSPVQNDAIFRLNINHTQSPEENSHKFESSSSFTIEEEQLPSNYSASSDFNDEYIEKNDILSNIATLSPDYMSNTVHTRDYDSNTNTNSHSMPHDEPFFETGPWSACHDAKACGQLGKRTRQVVCRVYLSKSLRFAELPDSSCHHHSVTPHRQEPCYMDCNPQIENIRRSTSNESYNFNDEENTDETIYDWELARFIWKKDGHTKCSAECLGGRREILFACWDKVAETLVESTLCDQELKPKHSIQESCNKVPCPAEWKIDLYSECSKVCGSLGVRTRSVACVQKVPAHVHGYVYQVVPDELCIQTNGSIPHKIEPCNRIDCKPEWNVSPWSECSETCGEGFRNRTIICVQEFATDPTSGISSDGKILNSELMEAITSSSTSWYQGKAIQVPYQDCYEEYRTVPPLNERCYNDPCESFEKERFIDADNQQHYRMTPESANKKTVTLKIGGKAEVLVGRNLRIRCRLMIMNELHQYHLWHQSKSSETVDWYKDGVRIFLNKSRMAEKQYSLDDNSILSLALASDEKNQFMADQPKTIQRGDESQLSSDHLKHRRLSRNALKTRSWNQDSLQDAPGTFYFTHQLGGRFSLGRENTLRIKNLRYDDSGLYTCSYGSISENIHLKVVNREELLGNGQGQLIDNF